MDLTINHISFQNFRSYETFNLADIGPLTIFAGPNAVGKTNIIEGIQLLTAQTSFRHPTAEQLTYTRAPFARIEADISDGSRQLRMELQVSEGKKKYFLNGKPKRTVDLKGLIPSVVFTPDDLELAKGSMAIRRTTLDALGSQLSANHYLIRRDYEKVMRHKNRLLKDDASRMLIESMNDTLVTCGAQLSCYRAALFEKLAASMQDYYTELSHGRELLTSCYIPSWESYDPNISTTYRFGRDEARNFLSNALTARFSEEQYRRRALVGPHADRIEFFIDGKNAGIYGSQGQQRSIVLAFKLAEVSLIQAILHQKPVLLLDDVMSELDATRRRALVAFISKDIQTFITTTNLNYFDNDLISSARIVHLHNNDHLSEYKGLTPVGAVEELVQSKAGSPVDAG